MAETTPSAEPEAAGDEQLGPVAARAAGERLRELADAEHARLEAGEVADGADELDQAATDSPPEDHPLAQLGIEPVTDEALETLGEPAADYRPCPFCDGFGAVNPDHLIAALPNVIEALAPYPASTVFVRCNECDGWGSVLTGGRTGDNGIQPCPKCESHGYIDLRDARPLVTGLQPAPLLLGVDEGDGRDPFTTPPPEGTPPAVGMEWDSALNRWQYPPARSA